MTGVTTTTTAGGSFRRGFLVGLLGQVAVAALASLGLFLAARLGGEGGATAGALIFLPVLVVLSLAGLVIDVILVLIPSVRARIGSATGLFVGWLAGAAGITAALAALFHFA
jgi:hypothetical protein